MSKLESVSGIVVGLVLVVCSIVYLWQNYDWEKNKYNGRSAIVFPLFFGAWLLQNYSNLLQEELDAEKKKKK